MYRTHFYLPGCLLAALTLILSGVARGADADHQNVNQIESPSTKPVGRMITLSDFGAEDLAYLSVPVTAPSLGIVLVPDAYGLDDFTRAQADRLATQGYLVVAVDIYNGHQTTDPGDLANLTANLNAEAVMKTVDAGIRLFHESPKFRVDHVIAMGWGAGATYVFQAARENKMLDGAITFYGPAETDPASIGKFAAPLCAVYPANDPVATHEDVVAFQNLMKNAGNDFEAWFIAADRGWSNPVSKTYNHAEDIEAWKVALPFIVRIGSEPVKSEKGPSIIDKAKDSIESIFK